MSPSSGRAPALSMPPTSGTPTGGEVWCFRCPAPATQQVTIQLGKRVERRACCDWHAAKLHRALKGS